MLDSLHHPKGFHLREDATTPQSGSLRDQIPEEVVVKITTYRSLNRKHYRKNKNEIKKLLWTNVYKGVYTLYQQFPVADRPDVIKRQNVGGHLRP